MNNSKALMPLAVQATILYSILHALGANMKIRAVRLTNTWVGGRIPTNTKSDHDIAKRDGEPDRGYPYKEGNDLRGKSARFAEVVQPECEDKPDLTE
ncbi:hypothetical protein BP5796_11412 [Coleophoma crateriformis]|uniref:Uncharacterized protein n=1 Tax=Coleophoma crateriformis TaxID=565419 RepID=A0A3D8QIM7_9HELO|nr:hypothetical protein BP5796_11412 [Coleophoma crateriformis]